MYSVSHSYSAKLYTGSVQPPAGVALPQNKTTAGKRHQGIATAVLFCGKARPADKCGCNVHNLAQARMAGNVQTCYTARWQMLVQACHFSNVLEWHCRLSCASGKYANTHGSNNHSSRKGAEQMRH